MSVKVITDSTANIPQNLIDELDISIVPIYVHFGQKTMKDGIDISTREFYEMLASSPFHPSTSQPNPEDFAAAYTHYAKNHDAIISIHISSKISGTFASATNARSRSSYGCPVEIIDSKFNSAGLGIITIAAAKAAKAGATLQEVIEEARKVKKQTRMFGMFEHMTWLARSGRISKTVAAASNFLHVMPLLTFNDGELSRAGFVRKVEKGMDKIYEFVSANSPIEELSIVHSAVEDRAFRLKDMLTEFISEDKIAVTELGASLGVHGGPGVLLVGIKTSV